MKGVNLSTSQVKAIRRNLAVLRAETGTNYKIYNAARRINLELKRAESRAERAEARAANTRQ